MCKKILMKHNTSVLSLAIVAVLMIGILSAFSHNNKVLAQNSWKYDAQAAVEYAKEHATDNPEFNKYNAIDGIPGRGSDCANFVSKCINAGGIPEDKSNKWYRRKDGYRWAGSNWMRTGNNGKTGVVIYLANKKNYFSLKEKSEVIPGSIILWSKDGRDHVALVIEVNGNEIKYAHHSNKQYSESQAIKKLSSTDKVTFYVPNTDILK